MYTYTIHCYPFRMSYCSAKFGTCTVVSVNGTLVEGKMCTFTLEPAHFIFTSVPFTLTTVQVPNLALVETKRITVDM
jgi:hypothetical protein